MRMRSCPNEVDGGHLPPPAVAARGWRQRPLDAASSIDRPLAVHRAPALAASLSKVSTTLVRRSDLSGVLRHLGASYLVRPFTSDACHRVLLVYHNHDLAWCQFGAFLGIGEAGLPDRSIEFRAVAFGEAIPSALMRDATALFVQAPYCVDHGELSHRLAAMRRDAPQARLVFFDWSAPTDLRFSRAAAPSVDLFVKKSVFRDRSRYHDLPAGHTNLTDHFAAVHAIDNPPREWEWDLNVLPKLRLGPGFAADRRLAPFFRRHVAPPAGPRPIDVHARLAVTGTPWYTAMRAHAAAAVEALGDRCQVVSQGVVKHGQYMRELQQSKLCFSPFGYGEICWRDVEAIATGAVMVKPNMDHLETWPDIYRPGETYLPVRWDLSDLDEVVGAALADPERLRTIATTAFDVVRRHLIDNDMIRFAKTLAGAPVAG